MTGDASTVDLNAQLQQIVSGLNRVTIYPSPYLVLTEQGYTKHYYAGADRVCARLGSGGLDHDTACISRNEEVSTRVENLFWHGLKLMDAKEFKPEIIKDLQLVDIHGKELDWLKNVDIEKLLMRLRISVKPDPWSIHKIIDDLVRERPDDEPEVYFYHSDHLGGASWITDRRGAPVQHLQYLPFGEPFVDQHPAGYQERYTFTAKERDRETGYGYFGARYMDHELTTMWLSVDPMSDKYPCISPYAYCVWNPVKLIDPDGREFDPATEEKYIKPYENEVRERMERIDAVRETEDWNPEYQEQYTEYQNILNEIDGLRKDEHNVYSIHTGVTMKKKSTDGELRYSGINSSGKRKISINLATKQKDVFLFIGTMSHELKHAYQYYNKQLGFILTDGIQTGSSNSQELEREAHTREKMFSGHHNVTNGQYMKYDYELNPSKYEFPQGSQYNDFPAATNVNAASRYYRDRFIYNNF